MKENNFSLPNWARFLCIAGMIAALAPPMAAHAADPTIEWIRIYLNPTLHETKPSDLTSARSLDDYVEYVHTDSNGVPIGATEVTQATQAAGTGDVIAIAIRLNNVHLVTAHLEALSGWFAEGIGSTIQLLPLKPNIALESAADTPVAADRSFTAVYLHTVRELDGDHNGGWFPSNSPFGQDRVRSSTSGDKYSHDATDPANQLQSLTYSGNIVYPKVDTYAPRVERLTMAPPSAGQSGKSRYHEVRQTCLEHHYEFGDAYIAACRHVAAPGWSNVPLDEVTHEAAYYKAGDEVAITVTFNEAVKVSPDPGKQPTFYISGAGYEAELKYKAGSGTDSLIFALPVTAEQHNFGGMKVWNNAFWRNTHENNSCGVPLAADKVRWIKDLAGNDFGTCVRLETAWAAFVTNMPNLEDLRHAHPNPTYQVHNRPDAVAAYKSGIIRYLVDTIPGNVWIPGLIKNGETHRDDKRIAVINLDTGWTAVPLTDVSLDITEGTPQLTAFDVEFRFFNPNDADALADEVGESFTPEDVQITGMNVVRDDWGVELTYVGLDHRATNMWPPPWMANPGSDHIPGAAKNSAAFLVYKATITPALGFQGEVAISLPAGATQDIAGNDSLASNTLTVQVDNPLRVVETPEIVVPAAGAYAGGDKIEIEVTYERENLRYLGENPPYLTVYLGEEVADNARHATWARAEDANSTKVTFTYTVAATDVAASVKVAPVGMTVPTGTTLLDDSGQQLQGQSEPANPSGEGLETVPPQGQGQLQLGESDQGLAPRTEVPINLFPFFEETEPKAAATDVPRSPIVFNELGNGSGAENDWLEFRNVTGSAVSLKEWELSVVQDGKQEDTSLIVFPDVSVPANGLLLITHSDPTAEGNVLAGGDDIATAKVETKGASHLYLVQSGLSLPDDGKFLLILRKAKEKLGLDEAFVDVAGGGGSDTDAFIRDATGKYDTHVWPLQVLQAPGGDTAAALGSGKVWQRAKADIVGYHKDAWAEAAFTGLGYDRKVSASAATAGTPGYPNVAAKEAAAKGSVTFSEIMFDSAGGKLPQWIELYNKSKTDVLNLNRWELEIQNVDSEDLIGRPIVRLTLQEKVIQPNQTLLIVTGSARASSADVFPEDRIYNLLELHDKNLRIKKPQDTFLSATGFYLRLTDRNEHLVDEIGNTDGNRRTDDTPAWALPVGGTSGPDAMDGVRSSLIRRYDKGVARAGMEKASWALAANFKQFKASGLHYGHADDIGTPGYRQGGALPVELSSFTVTRVASGSVIVTWTTESEVDNAGFNLRRSETRDSGFTLLNAALIAGAGTTGERQEYTFTDSSAKPGVEYYYQIEEVSFDGKRETLAMRRLRGPVSAANRMLTTFGAVKQREK